MKKHLILFSTFLLSCTGWYYFVKAAAVPVLADEIPAEAIPLENIFLQTVAPSPVSLDDERPSTLFPIEIPKPRNAVEIESFKLLFPQPGEKPTPAGALVPERWH